MHNLCLVASSRTLAAQRPGPPHVVAVSRQVMSPAAFADPPRVVLQLGAALELPRPRTVHAGAGASTCRVSRCAATVAVAAAAGERC